MTTVRPTAHAVCEWRQRGSSFESTPGVNVTSLGGRVRANALPAFSHAPVCTPPGAGGASSSK
eukprot:385098-Prymnesium_polylepis.1